MSKITINLYSSLDQCSLAVNEVTPHKDTLNVLQFAARNFWNTKNYPSFFKKLGNFDFEPVFYKEKELLEDYSHKTIKDYNITDGAWLSVGWRRINSEITPMNID